MPKNNTDVVIVGAGPTGLMAALLLTRCGVRVRILDKTEQQAHESRAFGVHAKTLELLLNIGLADAFLKRGLIATGIQIFVNSKRMTELNFDDIGRNDTPYPFVLMVPQCEIEKILASALQKMGIDVEHNMEVISLTQQKDAVRVQAKNKNGVTSDIICTYLIGADGAHSIVRKQLGLTFSGAPYPAKFLLADCKIQWSLDYDHMKIFMKGNSLAIYLPLRGKDIDRIIVMLPASADQTIGTEPATLPEIQTALQKATGMDITLSDPAWVSAYRIHHRGVKKYRKGSVFIAGDAAHIHSPAGGQGMNTGLQDVANLAWKLALAIKGHASDKLLNTYHSERWPVGQKVLNFTDKLFVGLSTQSAWGARLRNLLVPIVGKLVSKFFRKKLFSFVSQLGIRYHNNAFLHNEFSNQVSSYFKKNVSAGHRAPDGRVARNCDVFSLIKGYCFHVLALSKKPLSESEIERMHIALSELPSSIGLPLETHIVAQTLMGENKKIIRAELSQVFDVYGLTHDNAQGLFLIRPDGYIAYSSDYFSVKQLQKFLKTKNLYA